MAHTEVLTTVARMREVSRAARTAGKTLAFVPTMGYLHEGHLSLMREGRQRADVLVASIFVNPTQFAPGEDLASYPRDPAGDLARCASVGVDYVFMPSVEEMYPLAPQLVTVSVAQMTQSLCGVRRPEHFAGVTTVVAKLFHIVEPDIALFGRKDYQQLVVIRRMVRELFFPIAVVGVPTVREPDGLAMSSRNAYLTPEQRAQAPALYRALCQVRALVTEGGETSISALLAHARQSVLGSMDGAKIDYIEVVHPVTLKPMAGAIPAEGIVMALAVQVGAARLIDNISIPPTSSPTPSPLSGK